MEKVNLIELDAPSEFTGTASDLAFHIAANHIEKIMDSMSETDENALYEFSAALLYSLRAMIKIRVPEKIENDILDHVERSLIEADNDDVQPL